ncbi:bifunctional proline dehydrogenase/L-glutamate gamma-semialdehyde dehydrogenase PutA [Marinomonas arenicola]|uniref:Bifunctional protein PutA n=1 Tax=Marinomonas arenicola TaxID=569601 RepID=A0ABU9G262_9GAMM
MSTSNLSPLRDNIRDFQLAKEQDVIAHLIAEANIPSDLLDRAVQRGADLVRACRADNSPGLMEIFLAEYGLSTDEGVALMCLAEALLRVPDKETIGDLIEDKIASSSWSSHLGQSPSSLVNASTWGLLVTGKILNDKQSNKVVSALRGAVKRIGEPAIRLAVRRAMKEMGNQFVLGETIESAIERGNPKVKQGYTYSFDMLGEAALTAKDVDFFLDAYRNAIIELSKSATSKDIRDNPGISVKLSALHARYESTNRRRVLDELVKSVLELSLLAKDANMNFTIDSEESIRLDLSLDIIEAVLQDPRLAGWDGFGMVVQAYGKRATKVIDWLHALAEKYDRKLMVRLVKGAYWDTEIKHAQVEGETDFPVYTQKAATDVSYICCAKKLLSLTDRIYPQFATHNAHSVAAITELTAQKEVNFEFQCLHGMGESLYREVMQSGKARCRIYAPVGAHRDLLAYLVRRLLENGANSSFVNQVIDEEVAPEVVAADPFKKLKSFANVNNPSIIKPSDLFQPGRMNSQGWDLKIERIQAKFDESRTAFKETKFTATPLLCSDFIGEKPLDVISPYDANDIVGSVIPASLKDVETALDGAIPWSEASAEERAKILIHAADLYEKNHGLFFAVLTREAGKTALDAVGEVREAVDFLRYYANQIQHLQNKEARGIYVCVSPWNFPLAIFTGQVCAALAAGNGVIAKPAEQTPLLAFLAVQLLHEAGVPRSVLQFVPGEGATVGSALVSAPNINGVCFTGSTQTAMSINRSLAKYANPSANLIAETGGINAMIVDSTALPEQAIRDIVNASFQSAGQRCSALRLLYLQEDIAENFIKMLFGAMDELEIGDPWSVETDIGPVITNKAKIDIQCHIDLAKKDGRLLKQLKTPSQGHFVSPSVIKVNGIRDLQVEIFGPVLHIATFKASQIDQIVDDVNASGYGLTFGLHTRINDRVKQISNKIEVGNFYVNRNQIGAAVGSQPFGGEKLSGTGPKAGGPQYVPRLTVDHADKQAALSLVQGNKVTVQSLQSRLNALKVVRLELSTEEFPGPTGESNKLTTFPRGSVLCLGPTIEAAREQAKMAQSSGCETLIVCPGADNKEGIDGFLERKLLTKLERFDAVVCWSETLDLRQIRLALADREGCIIPLITQRDVAERCTHQRHVCIDTTSAGGNASLLAGSL